MDYENIYTYSAIDDLTGRTVSGRVIRYGEQTKDWRKHRYLAGAFGDVEHSDVVLNYMHRRERPIVRAGRGMSLSDSPTELRISATLPDTQDGNDAVTGIKNGLLTGFSGEVGIVKAAGTDISQAVMNRIGLVDDPAFPSSVISDLYLTDLYVGSEGIEGEFTYDQDTIISADKKVRKERVKPGAFKYAIESPDREINLVLGDNSRPLASKKAGSLVLEDTPTALRFKVEKLPRTSYTADFLGMLRAGTITPGVVPFFSPTPASVAARLFKDGKAVLTEPEKGNPGIFRRVVRSGLLTALAILFRPPRGNPGAVTRIPTRLARPSTRAAATIDAIRPVAGDVVRNGRVIRKGVDIGPVMARRRVV